MGNLSAADMFALTKREPVTNFSENQNLKRKNAVSKMVSKAVLAGSVMLATQLEAREKEDEQQSPTDDIHTGSLGVSDGQGRTELESSSVTSYDETVSAASQIATVSNGTTGSIGNSSYQTNFLSETGLPRDFISQSPGVSDPAQLTREIPQEIASFERIQPIVNISTGASNQDPIVIEGIDGEDGIDGRDGVDGRDGTDGQDGRDGRDGVDGTDGRDGIDGADGQDGRDGVDGRDGIDGTNGLDGANGRDGRDGLDGQDGADGRDGVDGRDGTDGINGQDGANGRDGRDGLDGQDGADGQNGSDGQDGRDGINGLTTVYLDSNLFGDSDILGALKDNGFTVEEGPFNSIVIVFDPARTEELVGLLDQFNSEALDTVEDQSSEPEHGTRSSTGTEQDDFLSGDESDNVISGFGGNDHLSGGTGADTLLGGDGVDTADYRDSLEAVHVDLETREALFGDAEGDILVSIENLAGSAGNDILTGDAGDNRLTGRDGDDILSGGEGNDRLVGGEGADQLIGGAGNRDAADYNLALEAVGVDLLNGGFTGEADGDTYDGIEFIVGSAYHDILLGNDDNNRINGGEGCDVLNGRDGNDTLIGEAGSDILNGGEGADVFVFGEDTGYDIIEDFEAGEGRTDRVQLNHDQYEDFDDILEDMTQTEDGVILEMDSGTILFQDLQISDFHADDFILA